jgi:zinc protease
MGQDGERRVTVRRVGDVQVLMMAHHIPAAAHPDHAALDLLSHVLGNAPAGRLYRALVETELASSVGVGTMGPREPGLIMVNAQVRTDRSLDEVESVNVRVLDELERDPVTEEELERARAAMLRGIRLSLTNVDSVGINLSEWEAMGDWRMMFIQRDRVRDVTLEDLARVAVAYLRPINRTVGLFIPEERAPMRVQIPEAPDVPSLVSSYASFASAAEAEAFEPTADNIEARTQRITLPGGMRVALLPKRSRGEAVSVSMTLRWGDEQSLWGRRTPGMLVPYMITRGTQRRTRQEFTDELARLESTLSVTGNVVGANVGIQSTRETLPAVLRLLAETLREPTFDEREFQLLKRQLLAQLESQRSEPGNLANNALTQHMSPYPEQHPLYLPPTDLSIEWLTAASLDDVRRFHADFYGAGPAATVAIVGDFDAAEVEALLGELFGDWRSAAPYERVAAPHHEVEGTTITIQTPDKANATFVAALNVRMRDDHPNYPAVVLGNYLLGGGFLSSRFANRVRQQEGLSYGIGSGFGAPPLDESGRFSVSAISAPENVDRVEEVIREEIERVLREGFTDVEVNGGIEGWLQARQVSRTTDGALSGSLNSALFLDRTMHDHRELDEQVAALTAAEVTEALRRHIDLDRLTVVKAGDF